MTAAITVENICDVCEVGGGCSEPCEKWYKCLAGEPVDVGIVEEGGV